MSIDTNSTGNEGATSDATIGAFQVTGAAFDGREGLSPDCTAADLFRLVYEAPNGHNDSLVANALLCAADDFALLQAAVQSDTPIPDVLARVCLRAEWRIRVAVEVDQRMRAAREVQS